MNIREIPEKPNEFPDLNPDKIPANPDFYEPEPVDIPEPEPVRKSEPGR